MEVGSTSALYSRNEFQTKDFCAGTVSPIGQHMEGGKSHAYMTNKKAETTISS